MNRDFPLVYRLRRGWRNAFLVMGAIFAVGGIIGALFAGEMSGFLAGQLAIIAMFLGFALMGAYIILGTVRTRVVLHADTIELHGAFLKRSLWRPDIAGRWLYPMQHGSPVIRFEPRSESLSRPMMMPQYLEMDAAFEAWLEPIPDRDAAKVETAPVRETGA